MGKVYNSLDKRIQEWISHQHMFFVATAPLAGDGLVNLSPKGLDTLRVLDDMTLAYLDFGGSGIETVAHLRENGRIVIMMSAFEGQPKIFRFHGTGEAVFPDDADFDAIAAHFDLSKVGVRSIVMVSLTRITDSCGYGVPFYSYHGDRKTASEYVRKRGAEKMREFMAQNNSESVDGLPGLSPKEAAAFRGPSD